MPRSTAVPLLVLFTCLAPLQAVAAPGSPSAFVQGGSGEEGVGAAGLGVAWELPWRSAGGGLTVRGEVFVNGWRTPRVGGGHHGLAQVGAVPLVRWRADGGRSPWFVEGGIGLSWLDGELHTPERTFRMRLNFSDNLGAGFLFGVDGEHEVSLRWQHTSNGGMRKPNPGQDLLLVRYAHRF